MSKTFPLLFTPGRDESVRAELYHDRSKVWLSMVQMPAMNTPQFDWVRSRLPNRPQPVPPIFQPEVAAEAVFYAAHHRRRQIYVGMPTVKAIYGDKFILKLYRKLEPGINPDIEIGEKLRERGFEHTPPVTGYIEYKTDRGEPMAVALLQGFVRNQGDAWKYTLDQLGSFYEQVRARPDKAAPPATAATRRTG